MLKGAILLVEDNEADAELLTEAFSEMYPDIHIRILPDGEKVLEVLQEAKEKPQLIILDLNLPKKSGLEILQEIRSSNDLYISLIPVLVLTNSKTDTDVNNAYKHRCNAFIQKPIGYNNILKAVKYIGSFWYKCSIFPVPPDLSNN